MTTTLIILLCVLLLFAYVFDITSAKTKIPSVILLLALGYLVQQVSSFLDISVPDLSPALPILGTVGLILIVLEGSLALELNKSKLPFVGISSIVAFVPLLLMSFGVAYAFQLAGQTSFKDAMANAIPFAVISSAIAIPSAQNLHTKNREFITYESSLSDIFGVILFNFITLNAVIDGSTFGNFFLQIIITLVISFAASVGLAYLLSKIKHHVKFTPIILMIVLIYAISKMYHLPALVFILLFGLFLGNLNEFKHSKFIQRLQPDILNSEANKFKELTTEFVFLIRTLFFLLFGFLIQTAELLNTETILWALGITAGIFLLRFIFLKIFGFTLKPLLYIAPRGLISILLFLSIPAGQSIALVNKSLVIQVIVLTALVMMFGLMINKQPKEEFVTSALVSSEQNSVGTSDKNTSSVQDAV